MRILVILLIIGCGLLSGPTNIIAQHDIFPQFPALPDAVTSQSYQTTNPGFTFSISPAVAGVNWDWSIAGFASATDFRTATGLQLGPLDGRITGMVNPGVSGMTYNITVRASNAGTLLDTQDYTLFIRSIPPPICPNVIDFALVLDASGSMNVTGAGSGSRWSELRDAVINFLPLLRGQVRGTDRLMVVFFRRTSGDVVTYFDGTFTGEPGEPPIDWADPASIAHAIFHDGEADAISPGGATPMGQGILDANTWFNTASPRNMLVFTDGIQNQTPMYDDTNNSIGGVDFDTGNEANVRIFSIGVGGSDQPMLTELAQPNGLFAHAYEADILNVFFNHTIPSFLDNCSPRIVGQESGTLAGVGNEISRTFKVDSLVRSISFQLLLDRKNVQLDSVRIFKNGLQVHSGQVVRNPGKWSYHLALPIRRENGSLFDGGGIWEVRFSGTNNVPFLLTAMVDDEYLSTAMDLGEQQRIYAGDDLPVRVQIDLAGQPIENAAISALVLRPGDLYHLASLAEIDPGPPSETEVASGISQSFLQAQAKIDALLNDPEFLATMDTNQQLMDLVHLGNGVYGADFPGTNHNVSGTYTVIARIEGHHPGLGAWQGLEMDWVFLDFARPADIVLGEDFDLVSAGFSQEKGDTYQLTITPTNRFGKRLGPAQARRLRAEITDGSISQWQDNLDGSYDLTVTVPPGTHPRISIYVADDRTPVLTKRVFSTGFGISLNGGYIGSFSSSAPIAGSVRGIYGEAGLCFDLSPAFSLQLLGGYYRFENDFIIRGGSGFLRLGLNQLPVFGFTPLIGIGAGAFQPENGDTEVGYGAKLVLNRTISPSWDIGLQGGAYVLPGSDYNFWHLGAQLNYYLSR